MSVTPESPAVAIARAHVEAWSNHDFEAARDGLAPDVQVTALTTKPVMPATNLSGIDNYMTGLRQFAQAVVPGSLEINASVGDERNALLLVTVQASFAPNTPPVPLPGARLYLLDEAGKIKVEQVVFLIPD
jgi:hypothetical protein